MASLNAEKYAAKITKLTTYGTRADWQFFITDNQNICPAVALNDRYMITSASCFHRLSSNIDSLKWSCIYPGKIIIYFNPCHCLPCQQNN